MQGHACVVCRSVARVAHWHPLQPWVDLLMTWPWETSKEIGLGLGPYPNPNLPQTLRNPHWLQPMSRQQHRAMTEAALCKMLQHPNVRRAGQGCAGLLGQVEMNGRARIACAYRDGQVYTTV
jgi:hypothetical protein